MKFSWAQLKRTTRDLLHRARNEHASPRQIAEATALGVFVGCSPAMGLHGWLAIGLATLLRRNRLFAFLGSRVCTFFVLPWVVLAELQIAHKARTGEFAVLTRESIVEQAPTHLLDWMLGWMMLGPVLGLVFGVLAFVWAHTRKPPTEPAPPSSSPNPAPPPSLPRPSSGSPR